MKITSSFKDYWDHAVDPSMHDPRIRYIRMPSFQVLHHHTQMPWNKLLVSRYLRGIGVGVISATATVKSVHENRAGKIVEETFDIDFCRAVLLVAGKAYGIWFREGIEPSRQETFHDTDIKWHGLPDLSMPAPYVPSEFPPSKDHYGYGQVSLEDWEQVLTKLLGQRLGHREVKITVARTRSYRIDKKSEQGQREAAFEEFLQQDHNQLCLDLQTPVVLLIPPAFRSVKRDTIAVLNPPPQALGFYKQMQAWEVWQEVETWIGGVMPGQCSPMVELNNESKIEKAGFDLKTSFRKPKESRA